LLSTSGLSQEKPLGKWNAPDGLGSVELLSVDGGDITVVNAARVSFAKSVTKMSAGDVKLIKYLAVHNHVSPFFHPQIRLRIKMPLFVVREWYRHTIGFARNEVSRRYVDTPPDCWRPLATDVRARNPSAKQGSLARAITGSDSALDLVLRSQKVALETYDTLLALGVAPEIARVVLPVSMYTEFIETGSLAAYARLANLRLSPDAQVEIRRYATAVSDIIAPHFPASWAALCPTANAGVPLSSSGLPGAPSSSSGPPGAPSSSSGLPGDLAANNAPISNELGESYIEVPPAFTEVPPAFAEAPPAFAEVPPAFAEALSERALAEIAALIEHAARE
jgi:thymidylate synthase (FAD)